MTLMLHKGGTIVAYDALKAVPTPEATATHVPLPHYQLVEMAKYALGFYGHEVVEEHHALAAEGARYFGLLTLKSPYGDYTDTLGLRNAHDKAYPIGLAYGAKCFVCDNLSFHGDYVIRRRHTVNSKRELPGLVSELIEPLSLQRERQYQTFITYKETDLTDQVADHVIMSLYREGVIGVTKIADVNEQWEHPSFDWGERTAWRLFNAATYTLTGRAVEQNDLTPKLHRIIDGVCERLH